MQEKGVFRGKLGLGRVQILNLVAGSSGSGTTHNGVLLKIPL